MKNSLNISQSVVNPANIPFSIHLLPHRVQDMENMPVGPCKIKSFEIIWVSQGSGNIIIDMTQFPIVANTLFYVAPGQMRQIQAASPTVGYVISFTESFLGEEEVGFSLEDYTDLIDQFWQYPVMKIGEDMANEINEIARKMIKEYDNFFLLRSEMLRRYAKIFLIHIKRQLEGEQTEILEKRYSVLVQKFIFMLEEKFREKKMVADYAEQLSVSPSYLNEAIKKAFGFPASHLIRRRIVLEAKRKALYSDANMKEVAYFLGFEDIAHFSKFFKNTAGINFTDFKKGTMFPVALNA